MCAGRRAGLVAAIVLLTPLAIAAGTAGSRPTTTPRLLGLRVGNGGPPFAGDRRLLTTVSPNGDGLRDEAVVRFRPERTGSSDNGRRPHGFDP